MIRNLKLLLILLIGAACIIPVDAKRESRLLDDNWNFTYIPDSVSGLKSFTKSVNLPHDWSVEFPFDRNAPAGNDGGYLPTGKGKYTKKINILPSELDSSIHRLLFEGVYERWNLKVNGEDVGMRPYGYSSVIYDVTPYLTPGENIIEVIVDNSNQKNCRWYTGSGIYRHVRHIITDKTHIEPWSLFISTPVIDRDRVAVRIIYELSGADQNQGLKIKYNIKDNSGKVVAEKVEDLANIPSDNEVSEELTVDNPLLWSPDSPSLYSLQIDLIMDGRIIDTVEETFGIRSVSVSAEEGLKLNGKGLLINGACVHHDHGLLGAASFDAAEARKVRLLKEAGFNAVRTSHNPPSPAFLDECDRQGLLVIDEAFDGWRDEKNRNDYHLWFDEWAVKDMGDLVRRDRNHPSIIAWSIGNEVIERKKIEVITSARKLASECRRLDPTRYVTEALCAWDSDWEIYDPHAEELDIVGYNYMIHKAEGDHERCPDRVIWQTESYPNDAASNWRKVKDYPYIIGDFVWTGMDYLGESGIGRFFYKGETEGEHYQNDQWPWHGAYCGDIDLTGWRKPISHYRAMLYNPDEKLYLAVKEPDGYNGDIRTTLWGVSPTWESWNWDGHEGKPIDVEVCSRYPKVRLYLNDSLIGEKETGESNAYKTIFKVDYSPGILKVIGIDENGNEVETKILRTTGEPYAIRLIADKKILDADNQDLMYVDIEIVDKNGNVVPDASVSVKIKLTGTGVLQGAGSADLKSGRSYKSDDIETWKGRGLIVVRATDKSGKGKLKVSSPGLKSSEMTYKTR